nr:cytochrome P450 [Streptomyces sp. YIM 121038]
MGDPPQAWPLAGHLLRLVRDPLAFLRSLPACGDLARVRLGPWQVIVVCDPALTRQLLLDDQTFDKGGPLVDRAREFMGNGLATCPHRDHRRQRRQLQPAFHPARQSGHARVMADHITAIVGAWQGGEELDPVTEMHTLTARVLVATMFGTALPATTVNRLIDDLTTVMNGLGRRMLMPPLVNKLPLPGNRRFERARQRLRHTLTQAIAASVSAGTGYGDLLSILVRLADSATPSPQGLPGPTDASPDAEGLIDQIVSFFVAGVETVATTLAWALHLLANHPDVLARLHTEVDTVLDGRTAAAFDDLPRLKLTGRILTETLRLYPPAWMLTRTTAMDTDFAGHHIPAGTTVAISPYLLHHRADLFPNAEVFDPDRWDPQTATPPPRDAWVAFGGGARKCIGVTFAMTQGTLVLATIAAHWNFRPIPGRTVSAAPRGTLTPRGLRLHLSARPSPPASGADMTAPTAAPSSAPTTAGGQPTSPVSLNASPPSPPRDTEPG